MKPMTEENNKKLSAEAIISETPANPAAHAETWRFQLEGLTCASCAAAVSKAVKPLAGVESIEVNPLTQKMVLAVDPSARLDEAKVIAAVQKAGYDGALSSREGVKDTPEHSASDSAAAGAAKPMVKADPKKDPSYLEYLAARGRFWPSLFFMLPLLYITMGEMLGLPLPEFLSGSEYAVHYALTQLLLTLPVIYINRVIFRRGLKSLWNRLPNMDALIAVGSGAAFIYGVIVLYQMATAQAAGMTDHLMHLRHNLYFESAAVILTLIALGKMLEGRAKAKTSTAIQQLLDLIPPEAEVERDGLSIIVNVDDIRVGDTVLLRPGQKVAVDGTVISGYSSLDTAAITGESIPVEKTAGDKVLTGMVNQSGTLRFTAEKVGGETTLAQIIRLVEEAASSRAPISQLADKISAVFVPIVIGIALLTLFVQLLLGQTFDQALGYAITVLVISCPCALGLATPVAIMVGTGQGAKNGILLRSGEALEHAGKVDTVVMDKTGTITEGKPRVTDLVVGLGEAQDAASAADDLLSLAASVEAVSEHPLAAAVVNHARARELELSEVSDFMAVPGKGVAGIVSRRAILAGNLKYMEENQVEVSAEWTKRVDALAADGKTPLYISIDKELRLLIAVADALKTGSVDALAAFKKRGLKTVLLTGDVAAVARPMGARLGMDEVYAGVLPADKAAVIQQLQAETNEAGQVRHVMMLGDGINDAPALAAADVGVAMGGGTDIAMETADVILLNNDVRAAVNTIALSRATLRNIKQNLFWAFFYNVLGIPLAAGVFAGFGLVLTPMYGAAAMSLSSLFVVTNALRLKNFKPALALTHTDEKTAQAEQTFAVNIEPIEIHKGENHMEKTVLVAGMTCQNCVKHVKKALEGLGAAAQVDLESGRAKLNAVLEISEEAIVAAVEEAGYTVSGFED